MAELPPQHIPTRLQGRLLLADPSLRDSGFHRSVILLADHDPSEGAYGLILNQPAGRRVGDFLSDPQFSALARIAVHIGGPVARQHLTFSALWWTPDKGLRFATRLSAHDAVRHVNNPGTLVRAFIGYSGWAEGQLEDELRRRSWIAAKPSPDLLAQSHDEELWTATLSALSPYHRMLANIPEHPEQN